MGFFDELLNLIGLGERFAGLPFYDLATATVTARPDQERYYPEAARWAGETGTVRVAISVTASGVPVRARVVESSGYLRLDDAAKALALDFRFAPRVDPAARRGWQTRMGVVFRG